MGRWSYSSKTEADSLKSVSVYWLKRYGYLHPNGWKGGGIKWTYGLTGRENGISIFVSTRYDDTYVRFQYVQTESDGEKREFDYKVGLTTTPCNYGEFRYWFICPLTIAGVFCNRRVGVLYKGGDYFGCRHCYDLTYESRNENRRYKNYPLLSILDSYYKIEELNRGVKRRYYAGKPTKKQKKIEKIETKMVRSDFLLGHMEKYQA